MNDLITPENLSKELLYGIFDSALMDVSYDTDGDVLVKEGVKCCVLVNKERIKLLAIFGTKQASRNELLRCVNSINEKYIVVKAYIPSDPDRNVLYFEFDILVKGGITPKNLVFSVKRFCAIPIEALTEFAEGLVE
jgi:hypothetical protein